MFGQFTQRWGQRWCLVFLSLACLCHFATEWPQISYLLQIDLQYYTLGARHWSLARECCSNVLLFIQIGNFRHIMTSKHTHTHTHTHPYLHFSRCLFVFSLIYYKKESKVSKWETWKLWHDLLIFIYLNFRCLDIENSNYPQERGKFSFNWSSDFSTLDLKTKAKIR